MNSYLWRTELKNASRDIVWIMFAAMVWSWSTAGMWVGFYFRREADRFVYHVFKAGFDGTLLGTVCLPIVMIFGTSVQMKRNARHSMIATLPIEPVAASLYRYLPIMIIQSTLFLSLFGFSRFAGSIIGRSGFAFINLTFLQVFTLQIVSLIVIVAYFLLSHLFPKARFSIYWFCSFMTISGFFSYKHFMQTAGWGPVPFNSLLDLTVFSLILLAAETYFFMKNKKYAFGDRGMVTGE